METLHAAEMHLFRFPPASICRCLSQRVEIIYSRKPRADLFLIRARYTVDLLACSYSRAISKMFTVLLPF